MHCYLAVHHLFGAGQRQRQRRILPPPPFQRPQANPHPSSNGAGGNPCSRPSSDQRQSRFFQPRLYPHSLTSHGLVEAIVVESEKNTMPPEGLCPFWRQFSHTACPLCTQNTSFFSRSHSPLLLLFFPPLNFSPTFPPLDSALSLREKYFFAHRLAFFGKMAYDILALKRTEC